MYIVTSDTKLYENSSLRPSLQLKVKNKSIIQQWHTAQVSYNKPFMNQLCLHYTLSHTYPHSSYYSFILEQKTF